MKLIFLLTTILNLASPLNQWRIAHFAPLESAYQLDGHQIIKTMAEPIEITNQAANLLLPNVYQREAQLTLPPEDLEYIRSNKVEVNLRFDFQFAWWNNKEYQVMQNLTLTHSLKSGVLVNQPRLVATRLEWPSDYLQPNRPFAHAISFYYGPTFDLVLRQELVSDLSEAEINAIARESHGAPQNYRVHLSNLQLAYPVPPLFYQLATQFVEVLIPYSRHQWNQWRTAFDHAFATSELFTQQPFDDFFVRPQFNHEPPSFWKASRNGGVHYFSLDLDYQAFGYLQIYRYFFPQMHLRATYQQYLDLPLEFDGTTLVIENGDDYWVSFKQRYPAWAWYWDRYVEFVPNEEGFLLRGLDEDFVRGEVQIKVVSQKRDLNDLNLRTHFPYLQLTASENLEEQVFNLFQAQNSNIIHPESKNNYRVLQQSGDYNFVVEALAGADFSGHLLLTIDELKIVSAKEDVSSRNVPQLVIAWPRWNWISLGIIGLCALVLIGLKFTKSKPPKK